MRFLRDGLDWTGTSSRMAFAISSFLFFAATFGQSLLRPLSPLGWGVLPVVALCFVVFIGHGRRRLRQMQASGWWLWTLLVPVISLLAVLAMSLRLGKGDPTPGHFSKVGRGAVWVVALLIASRAAWAPYTIPAGSMKPTLFIGDYILVTVHRGLPVRGDVVVFRHPTQATDFVKRVIGLPGDTVAIQKGVPVLNGEHLVQTEDGLFQEPYVRQGPHRSYPLCSNTTVMIGKACDKTRRRETLPGGRSHAVLDSRESLSDTSASATVPAGHVYVLGDNRDNSIDSRMPRTSGGPGLVPIENIVGKARRVLFNPNHLSHRLLHRIE